MIDNEERRRRKQVADELKALMLSVYRKYSSNLEMAKNYSRMLRNLYDEVESQYPSLCDEVELWHLAKGSNKMVDFELFDIPNDQTPQNHQGIVEQEIRRISALYLRY